MAILTMAGGALQGGDEGGLAGRHRRPAPLG